MNRKISYIESLYNQKKYDDVIESCRAFMFENEKSPEELLVVIQVLKMLLVSCIELKDYAKANEFYYHYKVDDFSETELMLLKAEIKICLQNFPEALIAYQELDAKDDMFFTHKTLHKRPAFKQHFVNTKNLLKRSGFEAVSSSLGVSQRIDYSIHCFFGLQPSKQNHSLQKGSFFNLNDITSKPFYDITDFCGMADLVNALQQERSTLKRIVEQSQKEFYINAIGVKNNEKSWQELSKRWQSIHILKSDSDIDVSNDIKTIQKILQNELVADCPPHAPEAFISILPSNTEIPPHYGLSNVKLTMHIPIQVNQYSSITVGGEIKHWHEESVIIFDDSFLHSAKNQSQEERWVLILDLWHPDLTIKEKIAIKQFMKNYDNWSRRYQNLITKLM